MDGNDDEWHTYSEEYIQSISDKWSNVFQSSNISNASVTSGAAGAAETSTYARLNLQPRTLPLPATTAPSQEMEGSTISNEKLPSKYVAPTSVRYPVKHAPSASTLTTNVVAPPPTKKKGVPTPAPTINMNRPNMYDVLEDVEEINLDFPLPSEVSGILERRAISGKEEYSQVPMFLTASYWVCSSCKFHNEDIEATQCVACDDRRK